MADSVYNLSLIFKRMLLFNKEKYVIIYIGKHSVRNFLKLFFIVIH